MFSRTTSFSGPSTAPSSQNSDPLACQRSAIRGERGAFYSQHGREEHLSPSCETNPGSSPSVPTIPSPLPIVKMEFSAEPFIPCSVCPGKGIHCSFLRSTLACQRTAIRGERRAYYSQHGREEQLSTQL